MLPDGISPLSLACQQHHTNAVKLLVENGASVDSPNSEGWSPMLCALRDGHNDIVAILLENGANVNYEHPDGTAALHIYCQENCNGKLVVGTGRNCGL